MAPSIDGVVHTFAEHGLYDGLFLMRDEETGTYWDHVTGAAVYGPQVGTVLEIANLLHSRAGQVLANNPDALIALSDRTLRTDEDMGVRSLLSRVGGRLSRMFRSTVEEEDARLPTMDIGMGIWQGEEARYYSYERVVAEDRAVLDSFQGRRTLVFLDPSSYVLSSFYIDADSVWWDDDVLRTTSGQYIEEGVLYDPDGSRVKAARPLQIFTRWYGFALTFPHTEIYGDGVGERPRFLRDATWPMESSGFGTNLLGFRERRLTTPPHPT